MRLHRLRMTAFQPFARTEEVDFDGLGRAGLFLMQGETGAGKTAILDAICFALFGRVPGVRDSVARLRSDHSAPDIRTEVVLELTLAGRHLRVTRSPKQERPKVRGAGSTEEPARATLEAHDPAGGWTVVAERIEAVEHELAALLGLTLTQFCQVVLLPQGAFARFLHAGNDEREQILQQLFGTDRYAAAAAWLADRQREAEAAMYRGLDAVGDIASRIAHVAGDEPPESWREEPEMLRTWLQSATVLADAGEAAAHGRVEGAAKAHGRASEEHARAVPLAERQARHRTAAARLRELQATAQERAQAERRLQRAQRAAPAVSLAARADRAARDLRRREHEAMEAWQAASGELSLTVLCQESAEHARKRAAELGGEAAVARTMLDAEQQLENDRERVEARAAEVRHQQVALVEHREWQAGAAARHEQLRRELAEAESANAALPGVERAAAQATHAAAAAGRRDALRQQLAEVSAEVARTHELELDARQKWLEAREQRLEGVAAELARELQPGEACRVCGAIEHPAPARHEGEYVDAARENSLQKRFEAAAQGHALQRDRQGQLEQELAAARAVCGDEPAAALRERAEAANEALAGRRALAATVEQRRRELHEHEREQARRAQLESELVDRLNAMREDLARLQESLTQAQTQVERARGGSPSVAARVQELDAATARWTTAADEVEQALAARHQASRAMAEAEAEARERGFGSLREALDAALPETTAAQLQQQLQEHDQQLERVRALTEDPELIAAAAEPEPDVAAIQQALREAEAELRAAQQAHALVDQKAKELRELAAELDTRLADLAPLLERRALVRSVAGLVDGSSAANRLRMPLAAYVLTARLEQIAQAASLRLEKMSAGRYVLAHCDERIGRGRKAGLGLQVLDGWTGRERPPASLSGGETFQASLALALGLADVVSAEAGGARLETLFVDEGFGSLGERALDDVLDVLDGLRDGGRAVGVISHVGEMRQRIPVQLHVEKGRRGSRIRQP